MESENSIFEQISQMEDRRVAAQIAGDCVALQELISDDLIYTHSTGRQDTKAGYILPLHAGELRYIDIARSEVRIAVHGDTAIVNGSALISVISRGAPVQAKVIYSAIWVRSLHGWRWAFWQATPVG
jgi:ketosteroid isomerase-like protein